MTILSYVLSNVLLAHELMKKSHFLLNRGVERCDAAPTNPGERMHRPLNSSLVSMPLYRTMGSEQIANYRTEV